MSEEQVEKREIGDWGPVYTVYTNCGNCRACRADRASKNHGPYYRRARRNPLTGKRETLYISKEEISETELAVAA